MALIRTPPGGSNTPFGGVGLKRSDQAQPGQSGQSRVYGQPVEIVPEFQGQGGDPGPLPSIGLLLGTSGTNVALTGVAGTSAVGTLGVSLSKALTTNGATGAVGSVTGTLSKALTTVAGTGGVGSVTPTLSLALTGLSATSAVGSLTPTLSVALTGVAATGSVGTVTATNATEVAITGVAGTGAVGTVGVSLSVALTTVAATGSVGSVTATQDTLVALTGVAATGSPGTLGVTSSAALAGTGATAAVGTLTPTLAKALTGLAGTGAVGSVAAAYSVALTGLQVAGQVGTVTPNVVGDVTVALTGVEAVGSVGTLTAEGGDVAARSTGAGRSRRRRRTYVEIDGEEFEVSSPEQALEVLRQAQILAEKAAARAAAEVVRQGIATARVRSLGRTLAKQIAPPKIAASPDVRDAAAEARAQIERIYRNAVRDAEIAILMAMADEADDEEVLLLSL